MANELPINLETTISLETSKVAQAALEKVNPDISENSEEYIQALNKVKKIIKKEIIPYRNRAWEEAMIAYIVDFYKNKK